MDMHKVVTRELLSHTHCLIWDACDVMQAAKVHPPKTVDFWDNRDFTVCVRLNHSLSHLVDSLTRIGSTPKCEVGSVGQLAPVVCQHILQLHQLERSSSEFSV